MTFSSLSHTDVHEFLHDVIATKLDVPASDIEDIAFATDYQIENPAWTSLEQRAGTNYLISTSAMASILISSSPHAIGILPLHSPDRLHHSSTPCIPSGT